MPMTADFWLAPQYLGWLLDGFLVTILLSLAVAAAASGLGFLLCLGRLSAHRALAWPSRAYLSVFRNTPLLVQLFFWYFGVSALLPETWVAWLNAPHAWQWRGLGLAWPTFEILAGFAGLVLYTAAFIAEELRAGVRGVRPGQRVAALALGLRPWQAWCHVVMPQAVRNAFPALVGQYMNTIKNTSLTMAIGVAELSYASRQVETETFQAFQSFGVATLLYVGLVALVEVAGQWLQRRRAVPGGVS